LSRTALLVAIHCFAARECGNDSAWVNVTPGSINAVLASLPTGSHLQLAPGNYRLSRNTRITTADITVKCVPGAHLLGSGDSPILTVASDGVTIDGCNFTGSNDGKPADVGVLAEGASRLQVLNNTLSSFSGEAVYLVNSSQILIQGNYISGSGAISIFGEGSIDTAVVKQNTVRTSATSNGAHAIAFHSTFRGKQVQRIAVLENKIENSSKMAFCVEVGAFGGIRPESVRIETNSCSSAESSAGGYSIDRVSGASIRANVYVAKQSAAIAGIELVRSTHVQVTANLVLGPMNTGIALDRSSSCVVEANRISGTYRASRGAGIHLNASSGEASTVTNNQISSNVVEVWQQPGATTYGIWVQANHKNAFVSDNTFLRNTVISDVTGACAKEERDHGTLLGTVSVGNRCVSRLAGSKSLP
jgi:parallel beta-helix repeat protein